LFSQGFEENARPTQDIGEREVLLYNPKKGTLQE
jgi:hypothetical protein